MLNLRKGSKVVDLDGNEGVVIKKVYVEDNYDTYQVRFKATDEHDAYTQVIRDIELERVKNGKKSKV